MSLSVETTRITVRPDQAETEVSPTLYGLFLEDINFACDGGLNANLVNNHSFEGVYALRGTVPYVPLDLVPEEHREQLRNTPPEMLTMPPLTPAGRTTDRIRHWIVRGGELTPGTEDPLVEGGNYARVRADGATEVENLGYPGDAPSMAFTDGVSLTFSAAVRSDDFSGAVEVQLVSADGTLLAAATLTEGGAGWRTERLTLVPAASARGSLRLVLRGTGTVDLDEVSLVADYHWGAGDPRWSQGLLRRDLVEALAALAPRFMRFPGGCIVEGCGGDSHYKWRDSVGPIAERKPEYNLWGQAREDGDYSQSYQVGFYEYFLLCEDLGMEPIPVVWSGDSCQTRLEEHIDINSPEFATVVQNAVDLLDWATGDPATSELAALRAQAGHPAPFPLRYLGIGNENFGPVYLAHFATIKAAVDRAHPGLQLIVTGGVVLPGEDGDQAWAQWGSDPDVLVDEHFYNAPSWFFDANDRYAGYPRGGAKVFLGEYAAHTPYDQPVTHPVIPDSLAIPEPNTWLSAIAEAAFLTGVERNADIVAFSCYAPLFNLVEHGQWKHNLIDFNPGSVQPTANYYVQQLFGSRIGERIAPIDAELPSGVYASATVSDGAAFVKLVNINPEAVEIELWIEGARDGAADAVELRAPLDAVNRLAFDGSPTFAVAPAAVEALVQDGRLPVRLGAASVVAVTVRTK